MQTTCDLAMSTLCALPKFQRAVIVTSVMDDKNTLILGWNLDSSASSTVGRSNQPVESTASTGLQDSALHCVAALRKTWHFVSMLYHSQVMVDFVRIRIWVIYNIVCHQVVASDWPFLNFMINKSCILSCSYRAIYQDTTAK